MDLSCFGKEIFILQNVIFYYSYQGKCIFFFLSVHLYEVFPEINDTTTL